MLENVYRNMLACQLQRLALIGAMISSVKWVRLMMWHNVISTAGVLSSDPFSSSSPVFPTQVVWLGRCLDGCWFNSSWEKHSGYNASVIALSSFRKCLSVMKSLPTINQIKWVNLLLLYLSSSIFPHDYIQQPQGQTQLNNPTSKPLTPFEVLPLNTNNYPYLL